MFKEYLRKSGVISTYYLKTIMMWAMEQYPLEYWREDNIGQAVIGLLDDLPGCDGKPLTLLCTTE